MIRRALYFLVCLYLFIFSLELIKLGAAPLEGAASAWIANGPLSCFGFGWLLACVILSGSPVAAIALALLASGTIGVEDCFAMIVGSRLGASFVVLVVGFIYDLRSDSRRGGVYVGILAFLTTASVYLPALGVGYWLVRSDLLGGVRLESPGVMVSIVDVAFRPLADGVGEACAAIGVPIAFVAVLGVATMVASFKLFDKTLPEVDPLGGRLGQMANTIFRPSIGLLFGMLVTCLTLSVSVSLTLLVPLTVRGVVRRENLIPYILGANVTTFVDTLLFSLVVDHAAAFPIVLTASLVVTLITLPIVFFGLYRHYERALDGAATAISQRRSRVAAFVVVVFLIPLVLLFVR